MTTISFDTETKGLDWFDPDQQAFLATWADETGEWHADLSDPAQVSAFRAAIDAADTVIGHNLPFDAHQVRATLGFDPIEGKEIHDTNILSRVAYPEGNRGGMGGHGLKNLSKVFLRADAGDSEDAIKEMGKQIGLRTMRATGTYFAVWRAYPDVMEQYARDDARLTYDLKPRLERNLTDDLRRVYELEMQVMPVLIRAEQRGMRTDQAEVKRLKAQFTEQLSVVHEYLTAELGEEALGGEGSEEALTEALLGIGVPLTEKTDTGKLATNKFALQPFERDFPQIESLFEHRTLERFLSTYLGPMDGVDVIHPSFMQCGAWTGRMACRRPNLQNWPKRAGKEVRAVLVPREGHAFVVCDYEGIEMRLLAYYLNDAGFQARIEDESFDPHAWMCTNIWGGEIKDYIKGSPMEATHRAPAKNILFAITYGAGKRRVANMLRDADFECDDYDTEAKRIISAIKASLPNWWHLNKRIRRKVEDLGYVNTLFGRKQIVKKDKAYVGLNAIIQGSAADVCKQGLVNVDRAVSDLGAVPLLVVHDEIVVECPIEHAEECLARMEIAMCDMGDIYIRPRLAVSGAITTESYAAV